MRSIPRIGRLNRRLTISQQRCWRPRFPAIGVAPYKQFWHNASGSKGKSMQGGIAGIVPDAKRSDRNFFQAY